PEGEYPRRLTPSVCFVSTASGPGAAPRERGGETFGTRQPSTSEDPRDPTGRHHPANRPPPAVAGGGRLQPRRRSTSRALRRGGRTPSVPVRTQRARRRPTHPGVAATARAVPRRPDPHPPRGGRGQL